METLNSFHNMVKWRGWNPYVAIQLFETMLAVFRIELFLHFNQTFSDCDTNCIKNGAIS